MKIKFCDRKFQQQALVSAVATSQQKPQWRSGWTYTEGDCTTTSASFLFSPRHFSTRTLFHSDFFPPRHFFLTGHFFPPDTFHSDTFPTRTFSHQDTFPTKTRGHFFPLKLVHQKTLPGHFFTRTLFILTLFHSVLRH